ncbi:hypothetical protein EJ02DRAFT_483853 [Clathrospora elynae]|uniref:Uncharacterized protein n=1 Tax=Clathrospora elynae TaxID=706981 RepID=A0A6A5SZ81_9PLEO|nr:hypothetical protein EJ02DRAFT_483853 [Clathrospora elynae]
MKFTLTLIALALHSVSTLSATTSADLEAAALVEQCGDLGVQVLPEGADPALYRACADHPPRRRPQELKAADVFGRAANACYWDANVGCSGGYCWKSCRSNRQWCWTADEDGSGPWLQCTRFNQRSAVQDCGKACLFIMFVWVNECTLMISFLGIGVQGRRPLLWLQLLSASLIGDR